MKKLFFACAVILFYLSGINSQNPTIVFSQNKCDYGEMGALREDVEKIMAPILNDLVQEGKLLNWGVLEHAWGDEWNWNMYYVSKDIPVFLESFNKMISKAMNADQQFVENFWDRCFEHKDAMYTETVSYNSTGTGPLVKSMTMFNLPEGISVDAVKASIASVNNAIARLGYPGNGYAFYMVDDDEIETQQCLVEGTWLSDEVYQIIHSSKEWREATEKDGDMWDKILADRMYRRYYKQ